MTPFPAGSTLTVIRGSVNTRTGAWVETSRHDVWPCGVDWTGSTEQTGFADTVVADAMIYAPPGVDVGATDRVVIDGDTSSVWDVNGSPKLWRDPYTGQGVGTVIALNHHSG